VSTAVYQTSLPEEIAGILDYLQVKVVFCSDQEQVDKLVEVRHKLPRVVRVIYEDPRGMREYGSDPWFMAVEELYRLGEERHRLEPQRFGELLAQGRPDEVCHLCLTSGTTGLPKGAMLTHRNYINMGLQLTEVDPLQESDEYLSFLPFAWIGEQMNSFGVALVSGITVNFPESVETAMEDFREIGPHFMFGAPRIYEAIRAKIWLKINESYRFNRLLYNFFMTIGEKAAGYRMSGRPLPMGLGLMAWLGRS
jgi:long-chain acyl-CoA synthetase